MKINSRYIIGFGAATAAMIMTLSVASTPVASAAVDPHNYISPTCSLERLYQQSSEISIDNRKASLNTLAAGCPDMTLSLVSYSKDVNQGGSWLLYDYQQLNTEDPLHTEIKFHDVNVNTDTCFIVAYVVGEKIDNINVDQFYENRLIDGVTNCQDEVTNPSDDGGSGQAGDGETVTTPSGDVLGSSDADSSTNITNNGGSGAVSTAVVTLPATGGPLAPLALGGISSLLFGLSGSFKRLARRN